MRASRDQGSDESARTRLPGSLDPVEIAVDATRANPAASGPAHTLLERHAALAEADLRHRRLQIAAERTGLLVKALTAAAGIAVTIGVGALCWDAAHARGLVIDAFSMPPDLTAQGLTGQEMASQVQDSLNLMQSQTQSSRAPESFADAWARDISVQIPETGVSIGEVQRLLRGWLGQEKHVSGAVTHTAKGLRLVIRMPNEPASVIDAPAGDTDALAKGAGEALYGRTQGYRYGVWLFQHGRFDDGRKAFERLATSDDPHERGWALEGMNSFATTYEDQIQWHRKALEADPNLGLASSNLAASEGNIGHTQAALEAGRQSGTALRGPGHGEVSADLAPELARQTEAYAAASIGDYRAAAAAWLRILAGPDFYGSHLGSRVALASTYALLHDVPEGRRRLAGLPADDLALTLGMSAYGATCTPYMLLAAEQQDWHGVLRQAAGLDSFPAPPAGTLPPNDVRSQFPVAYWPIEAEALARLGRLPEAEALIARTRPDCEPCMRARGRIAGIKGDWAGADHWFDEAIRTNPLIPLAYADKGQSLMDRGRADLALPVLREAIARGPNFADGYNLLAQALLRTGDATGALEAAKKADALAPAWGRNHVLWGEILLHLGKNDQARAQWKIAEGLEMPAGDRARLAFLERGGR